ncbi:MAG: ASCH domain-containing protein [Sphingomonas sp.]
MMFAKRLRDGVRDGSIACTVRIWQSPRVKVGGRYPIGGGHVVVDSIREITLEEVTDECARRSGFEGVDDLLGVAKHGSGANVYLIEFYFVPERA